MSKKHKIRLGVLLASSIVAIAIIYFGNKNFQVLNPQGTIASQQRDLMVLTTLLMLVIVLPIFAMTAGIVWKYRVTNTKTKKKYTPDWDGDRKLEALWWGFPIVIILVLSVITWESTHKLDPFKPIQANAKPLKVQVIALEWKWLFIYPEQQIATINYVQFPEDTPVDFEITSDAPMNSFWIPQLGGQIYAMSGMSTHLNLMADQPGSYKGSSANLSGEGFAGMKFTAKSTTQTDFDQWVKATKQSPATLNHDKYLEVASPSKNNPTATFATSTSDDIYEMVIQKYVGSHGSTTTNQHSGGHN